MTRCSTIARPQHLIAAFAALVLLTACGPNQDAGYEKLAWRVQEPLETAARPDPPPVRAGIGVPAGGDAGGMPQLAEGSAPAGVTQAMVEEGAQLYGTVCAACHGPGGSGSALGPALQDDDWINISGEYDDIVNVIHTGVPNPAEYPALMPPLGGGSFNDDEVRAIAAYIYALSRPAT